MLKINCPQRLLSLLPFLDTLWGASRGHVPSFTLLGDQPCPSTSSDLTAFNSSGEQTPKLCISRVQEVNGEFGLPLTDAGKLDVLDCLLWGWNKVLRLNNQNIQPPRCSSPMRSSSFILWGWILPCWNVSVRASGGSQTLPGQYRLTWMVINEKLLPEPKTEGHPVNVHSHMCLTRYPAGQTWQGSGEGHGCGFAGFAKALSWHWLDVYRRQLVRDGQTASDPTYRLPDKQFYTCRVGAYQTRSLWGVFMRFWVGTRGPTTSMNVPLNWVLEQAFNTEMANLVRVIGTGLWTGACSTDPSKHPLNQAAPKMSWISQITRTFQLMFSACYNAARGKSKRIFLSAHTFHSHSFLFYKGTDAV